MRKTSYFVTFAAVALTLLMNVLSAHRPDWLVVHYDEVLYTRVTVTFGLHERCQLTLSEIPSGDGKGKISYKNYECRHFPGSVTDQCEKENKTFCAAWVSAGYIDELAIGFASVSLVAILFGVTTHSRRRRIWRAVSGLVLFQAVCQISTFALITEMYYNSNYPSFKQARPGIAYVLHTISWILSILISFCVLWTGVAADAGHQWAAGNRAYHPIMSG
ncbi:hypothetical protein BYT27DRAFT_7202846 [Phlegmacium glaucopus]|nr:hypothetical protein BYT27DRAFT_7202846 [Phlegmacium glaucopus]